MGEEATWWHVVPAIIGDKGVGLWAAIVLLEGGAELFRCHRDIKVAWCHQERGARGHDGLEPHNRRLEPLHERHLDRFGSRFLSLLLSMRALSSISLVYACTSLFPKAWHHTEECGAVVTPVGGGAKQR